ncbi:vegetative incompatibility het-E-1 [Fusarium mundagurra]|uniref:Vegetative incompatibility het-E-1 n=1 Tax=Fusarium mundagurra TaxID=1567541 RepID=A0A8H5XUL5_9HYPO|nr:vegetative incompatibility het-E-1 [Fusarium mundagurra]
MDNITEKIVKVTDMNTFADLTPDHLKKMFNDIGGSPEKLRTILNLWFVPDFKPTFVAPQKYSLSGLHDIDLIDTPGVEPAQRPLRLIDLGTGNLVDVWNTSPLDSYCMLSHRWKGDEITLAHIKRAREKNLERTRGGQLADHDDDIRLVLEQSKLDIIEQEEVIVSLLGNNPKRMTVGSLLEMRVNASDARAQVNWARQNRDAKRAKVERCSMEKDMFDHLIDRVHREIQEKIEEGTETSNNCANTKPTTSPMVGEANKEYAAAHEMLNAAAERQKDVDDDAEFLRGKGQLVDAIDEMMSRLQRWKSAMKLQYSMNEARSIFQTNVFPNRGAYYIWSDTCCIDKLNYGELSQSLSLMGDWYANAEFCLVHLDTDWRVADAVNDYKQFKGEPGVSEANIATFKAIDGIEPEWASRAWTLQELVMSKMAYFINSEWKSLSRPVESLGYTYPLIPFIELYTRGDIVNMYSEALGTKEARNKTLNGIGNSKALESLLGEDDVTFDSCDDGDEQALERVKFAVRLISILHALGFRFPTDMTIETAIAEMTRSVYLAAWNLVKDQKGESSRHSQEILQELKGYMLPTPRPEDLLTEVGAQEVLNFVIVCLVAETKDLILSDRRLIANMGHANQLESWKRGVIRSGFSAQQVLQLSCRRKATVPVDHVYSLMGILGVRFQSFHAEGYPKALARLLDEVIISHNDVSVFNWAGADMGSSVRGRSMYPASHQAYSNEQDRGRRYNMMISAEVQRKRNEVMVAYQCVIKILRDAIDCIRVKGRENIPLEWVREISNLIRESSFDGLYAEINNIGKILLYIKYHCAQPIVPPPWARNQSPPEINPSPAQEEKSSWGFDKPSLSNMKISSGIKTPKIPKFGSVGVSKPSFGRHHSEPVEKVVAEKPLSSDRPKPTTSEVPEWMSMDQQVMDYLREQSSADQSSKKERCLPSKIQELEFKMIDPEATTQRHRDEASDSSLITFTCPNPIIINSSGIEGIFDIQRIIVTMTDREKLVRQVARAASPKQKISGWCIISTGFASVVVNFSCEQHMLKKQLDVEQAVEDKIIKEDRARKLHNHLDIHRTLGSLGNENQSSDAERTGNSDVNSSKPTKEEQATMRIIDFIQEPQVELVAGEWVLARFSGTPGAKWFLCYLELGSTHSFYGRRIATTDIDFSNSAVEPGLVNAWQAYMGRKKRKMCKILNTYIKSFESAVKSQERLSRTSDIANHNYERLKEAGKESLERVMSAGSSSSSTLKQPLDENSQAEKGLENVDSEDDGESGSGLFDDLLAQGREAATAFGDYTVLAVYEKICEMRAEYLDRHLATSVLNKTPKGLQAAVESVDENKGFLPAMFHSSRRVHMF